MAEQRDYASVLNALIERVKEIGEAGDGNEVSLACYQILGTAISEAEVWGVDLNKIGLGGYDPNALLMKPRRKAA
jgi:hypothetical protein